MKRIWSIGGDRQKNGRKPTRTHNHKGSEDPRWENQAAKECNFKRPDVSSVLGCKGVKENEA